VPCSISAGIGFIPLAGDIALAIFKANSRNCKLLEEYLRVLGEEHIAAGLSDLTPEPPALPGGANANANATNPHPAQMAARQHVKDHSSQQLTTPSTSTPANGATSTAATTGTQETKKKWYQGK
jgi:hypothetical protein